MKCKFSEVAKDLINGTHEGMFLSEGETYITLGIGATGLHKVAAVYECCFIA